MDQDNKKTIAFYLGSLAKGGAERVVVNLAHYFVSEQFNVYIVTKGKVEDEYEISPNITRIIADLTEEELSKSRIKNLLNRIKKLQRIWEQMNPSIIVSFIGKNNYMAIASAKQKKIPVIVSVRSAPEREYKNIFMRLLLFPMFQKAAGIVLQTEDALAFFPKKLQKKAIVLPNSLHPDFLKPREEQNRQKTIVTVGRIDKNKNQQLLIQAFAMIVPMFPDWKLKIIGEGSEKEHCQQLAKQLNIEEQVIFTGNLSNISKAIAADQIFVLPSIMEGMPNALMEAMALGLCCISTDCPCGGPKSLIEHGKNGLLVPVNDTKQLAWQLEKVMKDEIFANILGRKATALQQTLHPDKINERWKQYLLKNMGKTVAFYISVIGKGGAERVLLTISDYLKENHNVFIITDKSMNKEYPIPEGVKRINLNNDAPCLAGRFGQIIRRLYRIRKTIVSLQPDAAVAFTDTASEKMLLALFGVKIRKIGTIRTVPETQFCGTLAMKFADIVFRRASGMVFQNESQKKSFSKKVQLKSTIIRNPISQSFMLPIFEGERQKKIVTVGRLLESKKHLLLIQTFYKILENHPDFTLHIYGDGEYYQRLEELIITLQIQNSVFLHGSVDDIASQIQDAYMFVLTSDYEGSPNVLLEAMSLGLPCISTDCLGGGAREVIVHNENGLLIPRNEEEILEQSMLKLIMLPEFANQLGANARKIQQVLQTDKISHLWETYIFQNGK